MDRLERYVEEYSSAGTEAENALLVELERATNLRAIQPKMVSGRVQGVFMQLITKMLRPKHVLEIGTFTGYSALSIAAGLDEGAEIHTVEIDDELEDIARSFFERSSHGRNIHLHIGPALEVVPKLVKQLGRPFDMVFIDGDKREYPDYYRMIMGSGDELPMVRPGTVILTDNVLWYGKVAEIGMPIGENDSIGTQSGREPNRPEQTEAAQTQGGKVDSYTAGIVEFNRMVAADPRVENVILPLRDGINLIRVK